jgi:hypothetical protein
MKNPIASLSFSTFIAVCLLSSGVGLAQDDALNFSLSGSFSRSVPFSKNSVLRTDNHLTNGYVAGFNLRDAPTITNPVGAAAFQWGVGAKGSAYPVASALWFEPEAGIKAIPDENFTLGYLYYRNGTIIADTGARAVNLNLNLGFSPDAGICSQSVSYNLRLIDTINTADRVASADTVCLGTALAPLTFSDAIGNLYSIDLSFRVEPTTLNNTLSTPTAFRVLEGGTGRAELIGRLTTTPIPEPGSAVLVGVAGWGLLRRTRRNKASL